MITDNFMGWLAPVTGALILSGLFDLSTRGMDDYPYLRHTGTVQLVVAGVLALWIVAILIATDRTGSPA